LAQFRPARWLSALDIGGHEGELESNSTLPKKDDNPPRLLATAFISERTITVLVLARL